MNLTEVSTMQLRRALEIKEGIEVLQRELDSIFNGGPGGRAPGKSASGKQTMSGSARARIAAARRARWAQLKGPSSGSSVLGSKRRKMSAAGRARIAAAARARWARYNAGKR